VTVFRVRRQTTLRRRQANTAPGGLGRRRRRRGLRARRVAAGTGWGRSPRPRVRPPA